MTPENEEKLRAEFPHLYKKLTYFECQDGWFNLIHELSAKLVIADKKAQADCVKEKFGGLRFGVGSANRKAYSLIELYEAKSHHVCEYCGEPGTGRNLSWIKTLCEACFTESKEK